MRLSHLELNDELHEHSQPCLMHPCFHGGLEELRHWLVQVLHMLLPVQVGIDDQVDELGSDGHQEIRIVEAARVGNKIAVFALST